MKSEGDKLTKQERARRDAEEIEKLNRAADELGSEIEDTLEYSAWDELFDEQEVRRS